MIEAITEDGPGLASRTIDTPKVFSGVGDFGGGTLSIERMNGNGGWQPIPKASFTEDFEEIINFDRPTKTRRVMSGSTTPNVVFEGP